MQLTITIDTTEAQKVLRNYIAEKLGDTVLDPKDIKFEVKSKQNFRSEWEEAELRVTVGKHNA